MKRADAISRQRYNWRGPRERGRLPSIKRAAGDCRGFAGKDLGKIYGHRSTVKKK